MDELPDELVVAILSFLTINEAGRCSLVSQRWKNLWKYFSGFLDFDVYKISPRFVRGFNRDYDGDDRRFLNWVNSVLQLIESTSINGLGIRYPLIRRYSDDMDCWIAFAIEKKVEIFEIDLDYQQEPYTLTSKVFSDESAPNFSCLRDLRLTGIALTNEVMDQFLSNCPLIQNLSLEYIGGLSDLKISQKTPLLKHLAIRSCCSLENFQVVSAMNLVSCRYNGDNKSIIRFERVPPLLFELFLSGLCVNYLLKNPEEHFNYLSQMKKLKLKLQIRHDDQLIEYPPTYFGFHNLTEIELCVEGVKFKNYIRYCSLIKSAPLLRRFAVKLVLWTRDMHSRDGKLAKTYKYESTTSTTERWKHENLKLIEIENYVLCDSGLKLAFYLLDMAVSLEKMMIIINDESFPHMSIPFVSNERLQRRAQDYGARLKPKLPAGSLLQLRSISHWGHEYHMNVLK